MTGAMTSTSPSRPRMVARIERTAATSPRGPAVDSAVAARQVLSEVHRHHAWRVRNPRLG